MHWGARIEVPEVVASAALGSGRIDNRQRHVATVGIDQHGIVLAVIPLVGIPVPLPAVEVKQLRLDPAGGWLRQSAVIVFNRDNVRTKTVFFG